MPIVVEESGREFVVDSVREGASTVYRLSFFEGNTKVGSQDFHGDGTKDGDIDAQQQAQNAAEAWVDLGKKAEG